MIKRTFEPCMTESLAAGRAEGEKNLRWLSSTCGGAALRRNRVKPRCQDVLESSGWGLEARNSSILGEPFLLRERNRRAGLGFFSPEPDNSKRRFRGIQRQHIGKFHQDPRLQKVHAILGKDNVVRDIVAGVDAVVVGIQEDDEIAKQGAAADPGIIVEDGGPDDLHIHEFWIGQGIEEVKGGVKAIFPGRLGIGGWIGIGVKAGGGKCGQKRGNIDEPTAGSAGNGFQKWFQRFCPSAPAPIFQERFDIRAGCDPQPNAKVGNGVKTFDERSKFIGREEIGEGLVDAKTKVTFIRVGQTSNRVELGIGKAGICKPFGEGIERTAEWMVLGGIGGASRENGVQALTGVAAKTDHILPTGQNGETVGQSLPAVGFQKRSLLLTCQLTRQQQFHELLLCEVLKNPAGLFQALRVTNQELFRIFERNFFVLKPAPRSSRADFRMGGCIARMRDIGKICFVGGSQNRREQELAGDSERHAHNEASEGQNPVPLYWRMILHKPFNACVISVVPGKTPQSVENDSTDKASILVRSAYAMPLQQQTCAGSLGLRRGEVGGSGGATSYFDNALNDSHSWKNGRTGPEYDLAKGAVRYRGGSGGGLQNACQICESMCRLQNRSKSLAIDWLGLNDSPVIEFYDAVCNVEIFVVMGDDEHGFAAGFQFRQQLGVKHRLELRVLIRCPFIEEIDRTVLQVNRHQGQSFALALGDGGGGEIAIFHADLVTEMKLIEIFARLCIKVWRIETKQIIKEKKVGEQGGEQLPVAVAVLVVDQLTVEADFAGLRKVEAGDDFGQGGFAAAVATNDEHQLAWSESEIDGAEDEVRIVSFVTVRVDDVKQLKLLERKFAVGILHGAIFHPGCGKGNAEFFDFLQGNVRAAEQGETAHHAGERPHQIQNCNHVTCQRLHAYGLHGRQKEQNQPDQNIEEQMAPVLREDKTIFRGDVKLLKGFGGILNVFGQERLATIPMQFEFLNAFGQRPELTIEAVLFISRQMQKAKSAFHQEAIADCANQNERHHAEQHLPRKPCQINSATDEDGDIYGNDRHSQKGLGDVEDIVGQRDKDAGGSSLLELSKRHRKDFSDEIAAEIADGALGVTDQHDLRGKITQEAGNG